MKRLPTGLALVALACTFGLLGGGIAIYLRPAQATRNSAGTESIPNTFVSGTTISSSAVNANFADLGVEMTDSLNRSGKGGMLAALRGVDGTVAAPAFSWTSETGSGLYRIGSGDVGFAISGTKKLELTSSLFTVTPAASFSSTLGVTSDATLSGKAIVAGDIVGDSAGANTGTIANSIRLGSTSSGEGIASKRSAGGNQNGLDLYAGSAVQLQLTNAGAVKTLFPLTIGSSGTAISGSFASTSGSLSPGAISANTCNNIYAPAVTGAVNGAPCAAGTTDTTSGVVYFCQTTTNGCNVYGCNVTTGAKTPAASTTYSCRVFNP